MNPATFASLSMLNVYRLIVTCLIVPIVMLIAPMEPSALMFITGGIFQVIGLVMDIRFLREGVPKRVVYTSEIFSGLALVASGIIFLIRF